MEKWKKERGGPPSRLVLLQGTLDMLILQTVQWGPQHGYAITQMIRVRSSKALQAETGSLHPALHRLERQRWVTAEWGQTNANQQAKFYRLTAAGKKRLGRERDRWLQSVAAISGVLGADPVLRVPDGSIHGQTSASRAAVA